MGDLRCGDKGDEESGRGVGVSIETCAASESVILDNAVPSIMCLCIRWRDRKSVV